MISSSDPNNVSASEIAQDGNFGLDFRLTRAILCLGTTGKILDPNNTFDWIIDQSERHGVQYEFYFMSGKTSKYDSGYDVLAPRIQRLLKRIHERGHIIGLHPSYGTLGRPDILKTEVQALRKAIEKGGVQQDLKGGRQHYLRWWASRTWKDWQSAGLASDSSAGFAQCSGFRAGTCREYNTWSWQDYKPLTLAERPLIVMDGTLFAEKYMNLSTGSAMQKLQLLGDRIKRLHGNFVVLWHNDGLYNFKYFYENALRETL